MTFAVVWSRSRALVFGGLAATAVGVVVAIASALGAPPTGGVAAAQAVRLHTVRHVVQFDGTRLAVTTEPSGRVCFAAPRVGGCAAGLADGQLSYATGKSGGRVLLAGVAGRGVKAVIARLTRRGTVWPQLHEGAFYVALPHGYRLRSIVKVLADGRRVTFRA